MKQHPTFGDLARELLNQGATLLQEGKPQEAIPILEQAHSLDVTSVPILIDLGGAYVMAGRHKKAIPLLEAARDAEPLEAMVWINLGAAYLGNPVLATPQQQEMAIIAFEKALELNPVAPSVYYNLGLIHVDRRDFRRAQESFRKALETNPFDQDARNWLGKLESRDEEENGNESG